LVFFKKTNLVAGHHVAVSQQRHGDFNGDGVQCSHLPTGGSGVVVVSDGQQLFETVEGVAG
jgi:hypothetical protein